MSRLIYTSVQMFPADSLDKTVLTHIGPDKTSGLIWILTVCLSGGIPEIFCFEKKSEFGRRKGLNITQHPKI